MCGIAGIVSSTSQPAAGENMIRLTEALAHRGPDGVGYWRLADGRAGLCEPEELSEPADIVLGHRRLSIVDLEGGAEPMPNEDGSVWVVFNGEIYNHLHLRRELEDSGSPLSISNCDTETLVHGWEEWGEDLFGRLNGIFAFAIADVRRPRTDSRAGSNGREAACTSECRKAVLGLRPSLLRRLMRARFARAASGGAQALLDIPLRSLAIHDRRQVWKVPPGSSSGFEAVMQAGEAEIRPV